MFYFIYIKKVFNRGGNYEKETNINFDFCY